MRATGIGAGFFAGASLGVTNCSLANEIEQKTVPRRILGKTGEKVSLMGIGCFPFSKTEVTIDDIHTIVNRALELGVNYLDTAPNYGRSEETSSERKMGPTIRTIRDRVFLATKTDSHSYDGTWRLLEQSLKRLQTDHLDLVHLHNIGSEQAFPDLGAVFNRKGAMGALREAKEQGVIRYIGASGHTYPTRFHRIIDMDTGEIDVFMLAVNFIIQHTYDFEHKVWHRAKDRHLGLVSMKVLGGEQRSRTGRCRIPLDSYRLAIRYTLSLPGLSSAVIGVKDTVQLEQAAEAISTLKPLSDDEAHQLSVKGLQLSKDDKWKAAYGQPTT